MRAEELVALCGSRGVDLVSIAKSRTQIQPVADTVTKIRRGVRVTQLLETTGSRAYGKDSRPMVEGEWTVEDLGIAAHGVPAIAFLAACFAWAGDRGHYVTLHDALMAHALQFRRVHRWPFQVTGHDGRRLHYLEHICAMVLDEDQHPTLFAYRAERRPGQAPPPSIYAIYCGVDEATWERSLADRYEQLRGVFWDWLNTAARMIQSRLREGEA